MASRNFPSSRIMRFDFNPVLVCGSFSVDPGVGIAVGDMHGNGFDVAWNAAGDYTVTSHDPYRHIVAFGVSIGLTTPNVDLCPRGYVPVCAAGLATLRIALNVTGAALADPAVIADRVSFWMLLSNNPRDYVR